MCFLRAFSETRAAGFWAGLTPWPVGSPPRGDPLHSMQHVGDLNSGCSAGEKSRLFSISPGGMPPGPTVAQ